MITQKLRKYCFNGCAFDTCVPAEGLENGFIFRFRLKHPVSHTDWETILSVPDTLYVSARQYTVEEARADSWGWCENYGSYPDENGNIAVVEATIHLEVPYHPERTELRVGFPLTVYNAVDQDMFLVYDCMHLRLFWDGLVVNENYPVGTLLPVQRDACGDVCLEIGENLASFSFSAGVDRITSEEVERTEEGGVQYYSPFGINTWVGDVASFWHDGTYHILYLYDRHHGANRWWCSAHSFAQLTTRDFIHWTDHGELCPHTEPWQCTGTGTMFYWGGKYHLSFGNHTSRTIPDEYLYAGTMRDFYRAHGYTCAVPYDEIFAAGMTPNGANLAESDDGIHFRLSRKMFHWAENPSVYTEPDGSLLMCCGDGMWRAETPDGPWRLERNDFPPSGVASPLRNSCECPSFFEKNGYKYLLMGVTGFWRTEKDSEEYINSAVEGYDIYDGLLVPMVANCDGRLMLAGWLNGIPHGVKTGLTWGSVLVERELIQYEDGTLGMCWPAEESPKLVSLLYRSETDFNYSGDPTRSEYYELAVDPGKNGMAVACFGDCELRFDIVRREVQVSEASAGRIAPVHERIREIPAEVESPWWMEDIHVQSRNFSIAHVRGMEKPFLVRILRRVDSKMGSVILDAEIAGCRTIISNRIGEDCTPFSVRCEGEARVTSVAIWSVR